MDDKFFMLGELTEETLLQLVENGYVECKRSWFGRKKYEITEKGKEYFEGRMYDKTKYIQ